MKYFKKAEEVSNELAEVLVHNKYLLDDLDTLRAVIFARVMPGMGEVCRDDEKIPVSDISMLVIDSKPGVN